MKQKHAQKPVRVAPSSPRPAAWRLHVLVILGLLALNFGLYHRTLGLGFLPLDDTDYVQNNPYLEKLTGPNLRHILTTPHFANYAPLHLLSYALDVALAGGKSAKAMHLSNVLWHGWVACMVYLLAFTVRGHLPTAAGAALLFAAHPAHVEVVAWISSRKDLLATGFAALSMTFYLLYRKRTGPARGWWYAGSLLSFLLASSAKQSVVLLPAVMGVWDLCVECRRGRGVVADKLPFLAVAALFAWMTYGAQPDTRREANVLVLAATLLQDLWLLTGLGNYVLYHPNVHPGAWGVTARGWLVLGAVVVWLLPLLWLRRGWPTGTALASWVLLCLVPPMVLSFTTPVTDRYLFLPSVGFCLLVAEAVMRLADKSGAGRRAVAAAIPALALLWGVRTWNYLEEWRDPRSVWYGAKAKSDACQVYQYLGQAYQDAGERIGQFVKEGKALDVPAETALARAVLGDAKALDDLTREWLGKGPARTNSAAYRDRLWALAWQELEQAVAHRGTLSTPNLFLRRGKLLVDQGKPRQALEELRVALEFARAHSYRRAREESSVHILRATGIAYWHLQDYAEARKYYLEAQKVQQASGQKWVPTLDQELERLTRLMGG